MEEEAKVHYGFFDLESYIPAFVEDMLARLEEKKLKWGDKWKKLPVGETEEYDHQNVRFFRSIEKAMKEWKEGKGEIDWIDVANEALICWVRENDPQ